MGIKIFLSYSSSDQETFSIIDTVNSLEKFKEIEKVYFWQRDLVLGEMFVDYMMNRISDSDFVMVYCSPSTITSQVVMKEIAFSMAYGKKMIPIYRNIKDIPIELQSRRGILFEQDFNIFIQDLYQYLTGKSIKKDTQAINLIQNNQSIKHKGSNSAIISDELSKINWNHNEALKTEIMKQLEEMCQEFNENKFEFNKLQKNGTIFYYVKTVIAQNFEGKEKRLEINIIFLKIENEIMEPMFKILPIQALDKNLKPISIEPLVISSENLLDHNGYIMYQNPITAKIEESQSKLVTCLQFAHNWWSNYNYKLKYGIWPTRQTTEQAVNEEIQKRCFVISPIGEENAICVI